MKYTKTIGATALSLSALAVSTAPAHAFAVAQTTETPVQIDTISAVYPTQTTSTYSYDVPGSTYETTVSYDNPVPNVSTQGTIGQTIDTSDMTGARAQIVETALSGQGGAYVWGGKTYMAWDCSGFVSWVYAQNGINLTAYTYAMSNEVRPTSNPQPGDIVFTNGYSHVGIYLGNGQMISALNPSQGTIVTSVDGGGFMPVDGYYTAL